MFRNFRVTERFLLQFRAEAFNLTTSATFNGRVKSLNGYTQITSASNERQLRFALKLIF